MADRCRSNLIHVIVIGRDVMTMTRSIDLSLPELAMSG
jgi:hypothetical protein